MRLSIFTVLHTVFWDRDAPSLRIVTSTPLIDWPFLNTGKTAAEAEQRYDQEDCPKIHSLVHVVAPLPQNWPIPPIVRWDRPICLFAKVPLPLIQQ